MSNVAGANASARRTGRPRRTRRDTARGAPGVVDVGPDQPADASAEPPEARGRGRSRRRAPRPRPARSASARATAAASARRTSRCDGRRDRRGAAGTANATALRTTATRPWRSRDSVMPSDFEPALGVDGGLAAVGRRGDRLAVAVVVDVAGDEHAVDLRAGLVVDDEVARLVDLEPVAEGLGVGPVADGDEQAVERHPASRRRSPCRAAAGRRPWPSPRTSSIAVFEWISILGWARARSIMIFEARNESRRWNRWTLVAKRVRKVASSNAVSPPPTTAISRSRKKNPSQVAQAETPRPRRRVSESRPSQSADAPVATMTDWARYSVPRAQSRNGRSEKSTRSMSTSTIWRAEALGLGPERGHEVRALDAIGEARVVLDVRGEHQLPARCRAGEDDRLEVGPGGVDRGGQAGRTRPDDHELGIDPALARAERPSGRPVPGAASHRTAAAGASIIEIDSPPNGSGLAGSLPLLEDSSFMRSSYHGRDTPRGYRRWRRRRPSQAVQRRDDVAPDEVEGVGIGDVPACRR